MVIIDIVVEVRSNLTSPETCWTWHTVVLGVGAFGIRKHILKLSLTKSWQNTETIFKTYHLFIYEGKGKGLPTTGHEGPEGE
jgi:hypothetical protein